MAESAREQTTLQRLWRAAWQRPRGRWPALRWGLGLLVPLALILWGLSAALAPEEPNLTRITVNSQVTGQPIADAVVVVENLRYLTDAAGVVTLDPLTPDTRVAVTAPGYEAATVDVTGDDHGAVTVSLSGVLVVGGVTDIVSGHPVTGAEVVVLDGSGAEFARTHTDEAGGFVFKFVPEDASLVVKDSVYGEFRQPIGESRSLHLQLAPPPVSGRVVDAGGDPVTDAVVTVAQAEAYTDADGVFLIEGAGQGLEAAVSKDGEGSATVTVIGTDVGVITLGPASATPRSSPVAGGS